METMTQAHENALSEKIPPKTRGRGCRAAWNALLRAKLAVGGGIDDSRCPRHRVGRSALEVRRAPWLVRLVSKDFRRYPFSVFPLFLPVPPVRGAACGDIFILKSSAGPSVPFAEGSDTLAANVKHEINWQKSSVREFYEVKLGKQGFALRRKVLSETSDAFAQVWKALSEGSEGFARFGKVLSEGSDASARVWKMLSEASDTLARVGKVLSEGSDTSARVWKALSEGSDASARVWKVPSEASDALARVGKTLSEASDAFAQVWKALSEASDVFTRVGKTLSEASDTFARLGKVLSEASDALARVGNMPSEVSDAFAQLGKQGHLDRLGDQTVVEPRRNHRRVLRSKTR